jgi:hypothetical protein
MYGIQRQYFCSPRMQGRKVRYKCWLINNTDETAKRRLGFNLMDLIGVEHVGTKTSPPKKFS